MKKRVGTEVDKFSKYFSWLSFNERILEEAMKKNNPLLEKGKFLAIVSSNLDEFFEVKMDRIFSEEKVTMSETYYDEEKKHKKQSKVIEKIDCEIRKQIDYEYTYYNKVILNSYENNKIQILDSKHIEVRDIDYVNKYFKRNIFAVLTPIVIDGTKPFPNLESKGINIGIIIEEDNRESLCVITIPKALDRIVKLPSVNGICKYVLIEEVIKLNIRRLLPNSKILSIASFRITQRCDINIKNKRNDNIIKLINESLNRKNANPIVRLEIEEQGKGKLLNLIMSSLNLKKKKVYKINGPLDLTFLNNIYKITDMQNLKFKYQNGVIPITSNKDIFKAILEKDILLHLPFDSFYTVIRLLRLAANDPKVVAIKQTIYRVSENSPIVEALKSAAQNNKEVTVVIEVKARFNEERNIQLVDELKRAGCKVIYGVCGLKTHCKLLMIVRKEGGRLRRYVNMSTGNYHEITAQMYTDLSIFTCDPYLVEDVSRIFNLITGVNKNIDLYKVSISPYNFRKKIIELIDEEIRSVENNGEGKITLKVNGFTDEEIINKLYEAGKKGVEVNLIVRGICTLNEKLCFDEKYNIKIRSIVGKFLEHSRIMYFYGGGNEKIFLSSADLMKRNLDRRIEVMFPVEEYENKERVKEILKFYMEDEVNSRILLQSGIYEKSNGLKETNAYNRFIMQSEKKKMQIDEMEDSYM
ncbi:polyphosphate kinase 1 [Clostridium sp.]|uniref:polyphosphate kinase 1 n=1 Tax=Clostridium sp. TaxID=1506 RepID=UPI003217D838